MAEIADRMRELLSEKGIGPGSPISGPKKKMEKSGELLTIKLRDPLSKEIKSRKKLQKKLKSIKPQGPYKTKAAAKRAFLAGLIRKMSGESTEYSQEERMILEFIDENFEVV